MRKSLVLFLALTAANAGCSGDDDPKKSSGSGGSAGSAGRGGQGGAGNSSSMRVTATIGPDGGELATADDRFRVIIPENALAADTDIAITTHTDTSTFPGSDFISPVYELEPDGVSLERDVAISVLRDPVPGDGERMEVAFYDEASTQWIGLSTSTHAGDRVYATTDHFSLWRPVIAPGTPSLPISQVTVSPATLLGAQPVQSWWTRWEALSRTVTISGRVSPDGQGTWRWKGTGQSGTFQVTGTQFSFTYNITDLGFAYPTLTSPAGSDYWLELLCGQFCEPPDGSLPPPVDAGTDSGADSGPPPPARPALWSQVFVASSSTTVHDVAACPTSGEVWITGKATGPVNFGLGNLGPDDTTRIFLAKYAPDGTPLFAKGWHGALGGVDDRGTAVACDSSGNVYLAGEGSAGLDLDGSTTLANESGFLAGFDSTGANQWLRELRAVTVEGMGVDPTGGVLIAGKALNFSDLGLGPITTSNVFAAKFTAGGTAVWQKLVEPTSFNEAIPKAVTADSSGNVYVTGSDNGTADWGGGTLPNQGGGIDIFVAALSGADGSHRWSTSVGGTQRDSGAAIANDAAGNVYVGGWMDAGANSVFLAKYDGNGNQTWSLPLGGPGGSDALTGLGVDPSGNISIAGTTGGGIDLGGGPVGTGGGQDVFVAKLDGSGAHVWSAGFGSGAAEQAGRISVDSAGSPLVTGALFGGAVDFGQGPVPLGTNGVYLFKMGP